MKVYYTVILTLLYTSSLLSQAVCYRDFNNTNNTYAARDTFPEIMIADDFGPRDLSDDWHGGMDFNSGVGNTDSGDMLLAPEAGTFPDVNRVIRTTQRQIRYQILDAGDHRYAFVHMFDKHQGQRWYNDSTIYIAPLLDNPDTWGMVILIDEDTIIIGQLDEEEIIFRGDTLTVTNSIDQYTPIGILGNSGQYRKKVNGIYVWTDYIAHLHLNTIPDNQTGISDNHNGNPCQYVHYQVPDYTLTIFSELNALGIGLKYPGNQSTNIAVRTQMNGETLGAYRYNAIMDVNTVAILIDSENLGGFDTIRSIDEKSVISLGAKLNESIVNHPYQNIYPGTPTTRIHEWDITGMNSNAYNFATNGPNARDPWDEYFFIFIKLQACYRKC
jgi:hypothetical protein